MQTEIYKRIRNENIGRNSKLQAMKSNEQILLLSLKKKLRSSLSRASFSRSDSRNKMNSIVLGNSQST